MTLIDVNKEYKKAKTRYIVSLVLVCLLLLVVIGVDILLMFTSDKHNYLWSWIVVALITSIYACGVFFFFKNTFPLLYHYYKFYTSLIKSSYATYIVTYKNPNGERIHGGVIYDKHNFDIVEHGEHLSMDLYLLDIKDNPFKENEQYKVVCYRSVIISYEVYPCK